MNTLAPTLADLPAPGAQPTTDSRFTVPSIHCAGCIGKIERGLGAVPGVAAVRVNFSAKRVAVSHTDQIDDDQLIEELHRLGFDAERAAQNPLARDEASSRRLLRALAVAGFGMMNIMLLSVSVWSGAGSVTRDMFHWLSALIAIPVIAYAGRPFFASAVMALRYRTTNMDVPISIGVLLATALSIYETLIGGQHAYFDGAVMLLFFLLAGRVLDATMRNRARSGIEALLGRMGRGATIVDADGRTQWVDAQDLRQGMVMLVTAGEALAADGTIISGSSQFDNAMLTGESAPERVNAGDVVHAGTMNLTSPVQVKITATGDETTIAEIARLMDEAGQSRSQYVRIADRAARLYAPAVHTLALASFVGWMIAGAGLHQSLTIAIAVLIITCPCALGLAVPAAQVIAASALMKRGLLIKDGSALERLAEVDVALFDKTGTLTLGEPRPENLDRLTDEQRSIALALAQSSRHPLSKGIAASLRVMAVPPAPMENIEETPGTGVSGMWGTVPASFARSCDESAGLATDLVIGDKRITLTFADPLRSDAADALAALRSLGIQSEILSGDRAAAVRQVADTLDVKAAGGLTPAEKLADLERRKAQGQRVLMVGDGLNDGPALAAAHASIAPSTASDASQQAADAVFVGTELMPVAWAVRVARRTMQIVRQNFGLAIGYNILAVPLALAGLVTPMVAAIAMSASSLVVVGNSMRLMRAAK
ncbi:cadmium-translocating P-type ATPase [Altererythrobacter confluentis]|uniref:Cadmium-translocating P-type ATPase n=1 Tax=Allopontixanthobacter confluentis TaxID=1849021 RepID=A0A6L7GI87_9SPHN|nr:heavy metal translocating P-type ATPase [Allopontixanthobacter confluentis]MXP15647.1 cadmium-translocating P-type ATPase [Allopontixanthobacter confluentis]